MTLVIVVPDERTEEAWPMLERWMRAGIVVAIHRVDTSNPGERLTRRERGQNR